MEELLLLILFLISGYLLPKFRLAKGTDYKLLTNFVFYVCLPCSILSSFAGVVITGSLYLAIGILFATFIIFTVSTLAVASFLKLDKRMFYAILICGFFGNIIYFGFPFVQMLMGNGALPLAGIYVAAYNLFIFALLLPFISTQAGGKQTGKDGIVKALRNPCVIFTFIGIVVLALSLDIGAVVPYLQGFASLTTPISLVAMGLFLSDKLRVKLDGNLVSIMAAKIVFFPLITAILLVISGLWGSAPGREMLLLSFMPVAITSFVIADSLNLDLDELVMDAIVATSVVSTLVVFGLKLLGVF